MAEFPVPLDNLIAYVKMLHPGGGPLENVSDAFTVSEQLGDQADALIGYFVDQARRSGASWSQIGAAMGVSKQAAQKRFVPGKTSLIQQEEAFSRFTDRARNVMAAAVQLAAGAESGPESGGGLVNAAHLTSALLVEPYGLAAKMFVAAGLSPEQIYEAVDTGPATLSQSDTLPRLSKIGFAEDGTAALMEALKAALRHGHNYIGTEHLLLGVVHAGGRVPRALGALGLTHERAEELFSAAMAELQARGGPSRGQTGGS
jgi:hypothetical protein